MIKQKSAQVDNRKIGVRSAVVIHARVRTIVRVRSEFINKDHFFSNMYMFIELMFNILSCVIEVRGKNNKMECGSVRNSEISVMFQAKNVVEKVKISEKCLKCNYVKITDSEERK